MKSSRSAAASMCMLAVISAAACSADNEQHPQAGDSGCRLHSETLFTNDMTPGSQDLNQPYKFDALVNPAPDFDENLTSALLCIPGVGEYFLNDKFLTDTFPDAQASILRFQAVGTDDVLGALLAETVTGASGLNEGKSERVLVGIDLDSMTVLSKTPVKATTPRFAQSEGSIAVIQEWGPEAGLAAYDLKSGQEVWRIRNASWDTPTSGLAPYYPNNQLLVSERLSDGGDGPGHSNDCYRDSLIDLASGESVWTADSSTTTLTPWDCTRTFASFTPGANYVRISREDSNSTYTHVRRSMKTGELTTTFPDDGAPNDMLEFVDRAPDSDLTVVSYLPTSRNLPRDRDGILVVDAAKDEVVYRAPMSQLIEREITVRSVYDKRIYLRMDGQNVVIDATTGNEVSRDFTIIPLGEVNGYVVYDDGSTRKK
ncbi:hypothetical protein EEB14_35185 [Rhodococcus sp. WS4]|nr:hypothetical protein EEB14_35185 [Rhodococcus sp. WS4]